MSSSNDNKLCLDEINDLYPVRAFYRTRIVELKTRVELRMIKASAFIRSTPEWADHVNDEEKHQEWTTQVKDTFNLADKEVEYVFEELKYYAQLKENGVGGEELGAIDNLWTFKAESNCELAEELKRNAAVLECDFAQAESTETESTLSSGFKALVDPFLYSFSGDNSLLFSTPVATPEAALDAKLSRTKPGSPEYWVPAIIDFNEASSANKEAFDKREITELVRAGIAADLDEEYVCWLPTDFHIDNNGSVTIPSYINNLHPVRYAGLYQTISKVFAKFVPLLEQVTTDVIHPRSLRAKFDRESCITPGMTDPQAVYNMFHDGALPEKYQKYLYKEKTWDGKTRGEEICLDMEALYEAYEKAEIYTEPVPEPFHPTDRPIKPYSMQGLPLQASVEMAGIDLTPENPTHPASVWQAMGRAEERVFAVGVYFYDVENIANLKLKFRDPVTTNTFSYMDALDDFRRSHVIVEEEENYYNATYQQLYTQEVGEVEIKSGSYICYPNFYQTKMPSFELADPTQPGHVKYIAFYIVDPTQRLVSTQVVPPQQPSWATSTSDAASASIVEGMDDLSLDNAGTLEEEEYEEEVEDAIERAERLQRLHTKVNRDVMRRFSVFVENDFDR
ncbi:hypothetical protein GGI03_002681 [Coemansia sp. RSA 2337]|nr:hypothetical protein H4S04_007978 [Coemansia sp. S16]KAJ2465408.1 hypothetical protein GGI03_002681 [Coemansia sp. RSA 2337]